MELKTSTISLCEQYAKNKTQAVADGDVIVPDIKPDILKILQVDAESCVTDHFIENGRLNICGRVDYKILYVPDRANEKIKSISASMEFRQPVDACSAPADAVSLVSAAVDRVEFNAVNSRKLRLRAVISIDYEICRIAERELCTGIEDESAEIKKKAITIESACNISEHEFSVKELLEVPSGQSSVNELLKTDVRISDTEYKTVSGKVIVKGNIAVCILYTDNDFEIRYIDAEVPFTEVLDASGVGEDTICDIDYSIDGVMCTIEPDSDGDMRLADVVADIRASIRAHESEEIELLEDCYVPYRATSCEREELTLNETASAPSGQYTIREVIDFTSKMPELSSVYNIVASPVIIKTELQRGKLLVEGRVEAYVLYLTDSPENPVYSIKKDIKFSYMLDCETQTDGLRAEVKPTVKHISYNLSSGGSIELRCILMIESKLLKDNMVSNITRIDSEECGKRNGIIIYFAEEGDDIWSVSKRYGVPCSTVMKFNSTEDGKLTKGTRLFIPTKHM